MKKEELEKALENAVDYETRLTQELEAMEQKIKDVRFWKKSNKWIISQIKIELKKNEK